MIACFIDPFSDATATLIDIAANSLWPSSTVGVENSDSEYSEFDHIIGNEVYQSGLFNVTLNTGSQWDTTKTSLIDTLSINSGSTVNVADSTLISDSISLTGLSALNINEDSCVVRRLRFSGPKTSIICSPMTSLKTSIKTIT